MKDNAVDVVQLSKNHLRRNIRQKIRVLSTDAIELQSKQIASHVIGLTEFVSSKGVGVFLSMDKEVDTGYILSDLFQSDTYDLGIGGEYNEYNEADPKPPQRRKVYVPRVTNYNGKGTMDMLRVGGGWSEILQYDTNRWGIPEPSTHAAVRMENALQQQSSMLDLDVLIVPCVAFDAQGQRCGHGGGFYDRFIEELQTKRNEAGQQKATLIGVALEEQLVEHVVAGRYDTVMDYVVVPSGAMEMQ